MRRAGIYLHRFACLTSLALCAWPSYARQSDTHELGYAAKSADGLPIQLGRHVVAGGGGRSTGADFVVHGTISQHDADPLHPSAGGDYSVVGGFWSASSPMTSPDSLIFADGFE